MPASARSRRELVARLLRSAEPSIRWRTRVRVLGEERSEPALRRLEAEIRRSRRVRTLLAHRGGPSPARDPWDLYRKWQGIHWVLGSLAELGYPPGERELEPVLDRVLDRWTQPRYDLGVEVRSARGAAPLAGVPVIDGRARMCASVQGQALLYASRLGSRDPRLDHLAEILLRWQWPDGGWNCDRNPSAHVSSFMESLLPLRGLAAYAQRPGTTPARRGVERAAELFLTRRLFLRRSDGSVMDPEFLRLHYPVYWHYDALAGLKGLAEGGKLGDPRAGSALDWLEAQELAEGGWPATAKYYRRPGQGAAGAELVDWGVPGPRRANDWVSTDALAVLAAAGRFAA